MPRAAACAAEKPAASRASFNLSDASDIAQKLATITIRSGLQIICAQCIVRAIEEAFSLRLASNCATATAFRNARTRAPEKFHFSFHAMSLHSTGPLRPHLPAPGVGPERPADAGKSATNRTVAAASASARLGLGVGGFVLAVWIVTAAHLDRALPTGGQAVAVLAAGAVIAGAASMARSTRRRR
jgi:hypothetical protein